MKSFAFIKDGGWLAMTIAVVLGVMLVVGFVQAATTISTSITTGGTLTVTGLSTLGNASTTIFSASGNLMVNGNATTTASTGAIATQGNLTVLGTASTTTFLVGSDQVSTISGIIFGYCTIPATTVTASSTAYQSCTGATGVTSSYRVFVQATSSLPENFIIQSASSTVTTGTINVRILNTGMIAGTATGINSFNFWAVR